MLESQVQLAEEHAQRVQAKLEGAQQSASDALKAAQDSDQLYRAEHQARQQAEKKLRQAADNNARQNHEVTGLQRQLRENNERELRRLAEAEGSTLSMERQVKELLIENSAIRQNAEHQSRAAALEVGRLQEQVRELARQLKEMVQLRDAADETARSLQLEVRTLLGDNEGQKLEVRRLREEATWRCSELEKLVTTTVKETRVQEQTTRDLECREVELQLAQETGAADAKAATAAQATADKLQLMLSTKTRQLLASERRGEELTLLLEDVRRELARGAAAGGGQSPA